MRWLMLKVEGHSMSFRTLLFNRSVKNNILRDLEGEILRGLFLLEKAGEALKTAGLLPIKMKHRKWYSAFCNRKVKSIKNKTSPEYVCWKKQNRMRSFYLCLTFVFRKYEEL